MLVLRGLALGMCIQPLIVASLSEIGPRMLAQASAMNTVTRAIASSLGIAVLATLVQTQSLVHFAYLAEKVTTSSPLGLLYPRLQALFVSQGNSLSNAQTAALQVINGLLKQQAYVLAIQNAFSATIVVCILAIIAVFFVRGRRQPARVTERPARSESGETQEEEEASQPMVFVE
jgi:DHA2 family multidrug resistance protein